MTQRRPFVGGNWKMNTDLAGAVELAEDVLAECGAAAAGVDIALFPPFPYLLPVGRALGHGGVILGAQDVFDEPDGAFTGEVSVAMLNDLAVDAVLVGHSERRHMIGESDELIARKVRAALDGALWVVLCIGERLFQREAGDTDEVNRRQLRAALEDVDAEHAARQLIVAYEPVWAIGTGRNASPDDAQSAHAMIRAELDSMFGASVAAEIRIIYGGSVKPANAADLAAGADVDGFLVGGASLVAADFAAIVTAAAAKTATWR